MPHTTLYNTHLPLYKNTKTELLNHPIQNLTIYSTLTCSLTPHIRHPSLLLVQKKHKDQTQNIHTNKTPSTHQQKNNTKFFIKNVRTRLQMKDANSQNTENNGKPTYLPKNIPYLRLLCPPYFHQHPQILPKNLIHHQ